MKYKEEHEDIITKALNTAAWGEALSSTDLHKARAILDETSGPKAKVEYRTQMNMRGRCEWTDCTNSCDADQDYCLLHMGISTTCAAPSVLAAPDESEVAQFRRRMDSIEQRLATMERLLRKKNEPRK